MQQGYGISSGVGVQEHVNLSPQIIRSLSGEGESSWNFPSGMELHNRNNLAAVL